jgi:hypothetical protein
MDLGDLSSVLLVQQMKSADFDIASRRAAVGLCGLRPARRAGSRPFGSDT